MLSLDVEAVNDVYAGVNLDLAVLENAVKKVYLVVQLLLMVYGRYYRKILVLGAWRCPSRREFRGLFWSLKTVVEQKSILCLFLHLSGAFIDSQVDIFHLIMIPFHPLLLCFFSEGFLALFIF